MDGAEMKERWHCRDGEGDEALGGDGVEIKIGI